MTKHSIKTAINIDASPSAVWSVLIDFEKYPEWNPFIQSITGDVQVGNRIEVKLPGMTFKPTILALDKDTEFRWLGHLWFRGLFDGEHRFQLKANADGSTTLEHSEDFNGLLTGIILGKVREDTINGFKQMNEKLKERVEKLTTDNKE